MSAIQATPTLAEQPLFRTYALGEILPDMRVPIQRSTGGEGGWYVIIGSQEGWAQFLSQMGQPASIWQPVDWEQEILIGALLGLRQSRQHRIEIVDFVTGGVEVLITVDVTAPAPDQAAVGWTTYPFHLIRVLRVELPLGSATLRFVDAGGNDLASQIADASEINLIWLNGVQAVFPTPTPVLAAMTPQPTPTSTPVPNLQVRCIVLAVLPEQRAVRVVPETGVWQIVSLMEGSSILLQDGQSTTLSQLQPGMTIGVLGYPSEDQSIRAAHIDVLKPPAESTTFATYTARSAALSTIYNGYDLPLSLDTIQSPVTLAGMFGISQTEVLTSNGFVIRPAGYQNFAELYTDPQYADYPLFISTDSVLHVSQMLFARTRRAVEQTYLLPELDWLDREMFELSWAQYQDVVQQKSVSSQAVAGAALQNAANFAVALSLLDADFSPPEVISSVVSAELALIRAAEGITISPLFDSAVLATTITDSEKLYIDYARFAPQAQIDDQTHYAQALAWHEQAGWRLSQPGEAFSTVLLAYTLDQNNALRMLWERIFSVRQFLNGQSTTLSTADVCTIYKQIWGTNPAMVDLADPARLDVFIRAASTLSPAQENGQSGQNPVDLTWLGMPLGPDRAILTQMTQTDEMTTTLDLSAVHLAAMLNGPEAYSVVNEMGHGTHIDVLDRVNASLSALDPAVWTSTNDWLRLGIYRTMVQDKSTAYPKWMRTRAWRRKDLQTMLGHWVDAQRAAPAVTMARQTSLAVSTAPWGYVEPQPQVYGQLTAWTQMLIDGLDSRLMLPDAEEAMLAEWQSWLVLLQDVARRELTGQTLTDLEYQRLIDYGALIAKLTLLALEDTLIDTEAADTYDPAAQTILAQDQGVSKIAAIGRIDELYVVVERGQQRFLARGGVYSFYEFEWPLPTLPGDLLWHELLAGQELPRPEWLDEIILP
ncbi:MAG: DUF3160 domain-containing protein [Anaerolineae bacterium]|nr:DUF3160 domain-containing protein [Anaerolineae bacterium]